MEIYIYRNILIAFDEYKILGMSYFMIYSTMDDERYVN